MSNLDGLPTLVTLKGPNDVAVPNNLVCVDETKHIAGLDGLRAIAICLVLIAFEFEFGAEFSTGQVERLFSKVAGHLGSFYDS